MDRATASYDRWYEALARGRGAVYEHMVSMARELDQPLGRQGFSTTAGIVALGQAVGAAPGRVVLDICCGIGGPATVLATRLGCTVVGLDSAPSGLRLAASRADGLTRFVAGDARQQPFPDERFDAALVLDSLASFPDRLGLLREVCRVLVPAGRFGCTVEAGEPFSPEEQARMASGASWAAIEPADSFLSTLRRAGFRPLEVDDRTTSETRVARGLADGLARDRAALVQELGTEPVEALLATIHTWAGVLTSRRLAMLAVTAERID